MCLGGVQIPGGGDASWLVVRGLTIGRDRWPGRIPYGRQMGVASQIQSTGVSLFQSVNFNVRLMLHLHVV